MNKLCIAIPTTGTVKTKTLMSLVPALKNASFEYVLATHESSILHYSRELLVKTGISYGCSHILFVDSDISFGTDAIERLLKHDKDIMGVPYNVKQAEKVSTLKKDIGDGEIWEEHGDLVKCAAVGAGLLLIKASVFENLPHPWFFWETDNEGNTTLGEDSWFCRLARRYGFEIWADLMAEVKHIGDYAY